MLRFESDCRLNNATHAEPSDAPKSRVGRFPMVSLFAATSVIAVVRPTRRRAEPPSRGATWPVDVGILLLIGIHITRAGRPNLR